jgi:hypothetical protein
MRKGVYYVQDSDSMIFRDGDVVTIRVVDDKLDIQDNHSPDSSANASNASIEEID